MNIKTQLEFKIMFNGNIWHMLVGRYNSNCNSCERITMPVDLGHDALFVNCVNAIALCLI